MQEDNGAPNQEDVIRLEPEEAGHADFDPIAAMQQMMGQAQAKTTRVRVVVPKPAHYDAAEPCTVVMNIVSQGPDTDMEMHVEGTPEDELELQHIIAIMRELV